MRSTIANIYIYADNIYVHAMCAQLLLLGAAASSVRVASKECASKYLVRFYDNTSASLNVNGDHHNVVHVGGKHAMCAIAKNSLYPPLVALLFVYDYETFVIYLCLR